MLLLAYYISIIIYVFLKLHNFIILNFPPFLFHHARCSYLVNRKVTNMLAIRTASFVSDYRGLSEIILIRSSVFVERPPYRSFAIHNYPSWACEICVWYLFIDRTTYSTSHEQTIAVQTVGSLRGAAHRCTSPSLGDMKFRNLRVIGTTSAFDIEGTHCG